MPPLRIDSRVTNRMVGGGDVSCCARHASLLPRSGYVSQATCRDDDSLDDVS